MNVIEMSKWVDAEGKVSFVDRLTSYLDYGSAWHRGIQAQEIATKHLGKSLGEEHILIRNAEIPGVDESIPYMVLIGPQGVRIIQSHSIRGVFRAKGSEWLKFHQGSRRFRKERKNIQTNAINIDQQVSRLLEVQGFKNIVTEPVLIFTRPRTLVDSARPVCRVVSIDAIEYFASNIEQMPAIFDSEQVHAIADAILYPQIPEPEPTTGFFDEYESMYDIDEPQAADEALEFDLGDESDEIASGLQTQDAMFFDESGQSAFAEEAFEESFTDEESEPEEAKKKRLRRPKLSKKQWLILAALVVIQIIVTLIFAYIVLKDSGIL